MALTLESHPRSLMNKEELAQWIPRQLGWPIVQVEAHAQHVEDSIDEAMAWFVAKKGTTKKVMLTVQQGVTEYPMADEMSKVVDVIFQAPQLDFEMVGYPFMVLGGLIPATSVMAPQSGGFYSNLIQIQQHVKQAKMILGGDMEWSQVGRLLYIFGHRTSLLAQVEYIPFHITLEQLEARDHDMVKRYSLAWFKGILGRILRKHKTMPGADQGVELDGEELKEESNEELEKLEEELSKSGYPLMIVRG